MNEVSSDDGWNDAEWFERLIAEASDGLIGMSPEDGFEQECMSAAGPERTSGAGPVTGASTEGVLK